MSAFHRWRLASDHGNKSEEVRWDQEGIVEFESKLVVFGKDFPVLQTQIAGIRVD